jgi:hypothetical protein
MKNILPWCAWIGGLLGWSVAQQFGSSAVQLDCRHAAASTLISGALGAAVVLLGAMASWPVWRAKADLAKPGGGTRGFLAGTGLLAAAIFLLAILFQTVSSFIIPRCFG